LTEFFALTSFVGFCPLYVPLKLSKKERTPEKLSILYVLLGQSQKGYVSLETNFYLASKQNAASEVMGVNKTGNAYSRGSSK